MICWPDDNKKALFKTGLIFSSIRNNFPRAGSLFEGLDGVISAIKIRRYRKISCPEKINEYSKKVKVTCEDGCCPRWLTIR